MDMGGWQIPGMPQASNVADLLRALQTQADLLADMPESIAEIHRGTKGLAETLELTKATVVTANRVVERLDRLVNELDDPVRGLKASIERVNQVLEAPVFERMPALLESVEDTVAPVVRSAARARARLSRVAYWRRRLLGRQRETQS